LNDRIVEIENNYATNTDLTNLSNQWTIWGNNIDTRLTKVEAATWSRTEIEGVIEDKLKDYKLI
jgi:hypothetical protein